MGEGGQVFRIWHFRGKFSSHYFWKENKVADWLAGWTTKSVILGFGPTPSPPTAEIATSKSVLGGTGKLIASGFCPYSFCTVYTVAHRMFSFQTFSGRSQTYWTFHWIRLNICWLQNVQSVWPPCWALFTLVESCSVKFYHSQTFHWTNVEWLNISFVFRNVVCCSVRLTSHWTFVQFVHVQWGVKVSAKFSLIQQNVQYVWPPSNWTSLNNTQLWWTNVQCCSVRMFSTFDQGLTLFLKFTMKYWVGEG